MNDVTQLAGLLLLGATTAFLTYRNSRLRKDNDKLEKRNELAEEERIKLDSAREQGMLALLKQELQKECRHILTRLGNDDKAYIYSTELESINLMNNAYHALGGNGQIAALVKTVQVLPLKALQDYPL